MSMIFDLILAILSHFLFFKTRSLAKTIVELYFIPTFPFFVSDIQYYLYESAD